MAGYAAKARLTRPTCASSWVFAAVVLCFGSSAWAYVDPDDQKLIDVANCDELVREYKTHLEGEKKIAAEIQSRRNSTTASNVVGLAALAVLGIGFFHWNDHSSAEENLAEMKAYREAIGVAAKKKQCAI